MKILYICYLDFNIIDSGNSIRPYKMYNAFKELGHDILLLASNQDRKNRQNRTKLVADIINKLDSWRPDICYFESPTLPIKYSCDYKLIKVVKQKNIPCAYFYRDFYFSFTGIVKNTCFLSYVRTFYMKYLESKTVRALKQFDIVYFPSKECFKYFQFKNMKTLPPAGNISIPYTYVDNKVSIYVGGLKHRYGIDLIEEAYKILNKDGEYKLIIVCREDDFAEYSHLANYPYIEIVHASGDSLKQYYNKASLALLPLLKIPYNDLAVAVKIFEYMSYGKAIIATSNSATKCIIDECQSGFCCNDNANDLANQIKSLFNNNALLKQCSQNAYKSIQLKHNWLNRASQVCTDLSEVKNEK